MELYCIQYNIIYHGKNSNQRTCDYFESIVIHWIWDFSTKNDSRFQEYKNTL